MKPKPGAPYLPERNPRSHGRATADANNCAPACRVDGQYRPVDDPQRRIDD